MVGVSGDPFYLKFWFKLTPLERNRRFSVDRSYRLSVAPTCRSININRKSTTRFSISLRCTLLLSPQRKLKNAKRPFSAWNRTSLEESLLQKFLCVKTVSNKVVKRLSLYPSKKWLVGDIPSTWKFGGYWSTPLQNVDFQSIFARNASAVTPIGKRV